MKKILLITISLILLTLLTVPVFAEIDWNSYYDSYNILEPVYYTSSGTLIPNSSSAFLGMYAICNSAGEISCSGTVSNYGCDLIFFRDLSLPTGTYTLNLGNYYSGLNPYFNITDNGTTTSTRIYSATHTFTISNNNTTITCWVNFVNGTNYTVEFSPCIATGSIAKPFKPNISYFVTYGDKTPTLLNPFTSATYTAFHDGGDDAGLGYINSAIVFTNNGFTYSTSYNYGSPATYYITFSNPLYIGDYPVYLSGAWIEGSTIHCENATSGNVNLIVTRDNSGRLFLSVDTSGYIAYPIAITEMTFSSITPAGLGMYVNYPEYNLGFTNGLSALNQISEEGAYNDGFASGYRSGFIEGKAEGLQLSETGDWRSLISAVLEAPVNTFQSLFSFEVLGMDMRQAIGAILALCVILIIIKKVVL